MQYEIGSIKKSVYDMGKNLSEVSNRERFDRHTLDQKIKEMSEGINKLCNAMIELDKKVSVIENELLKHKNVNVANNINDIEGLYDVLIDGERKENEGG